MNPRPASRPRRTAGPALVAVLLSILCACSSAPPKPSAPPAPPVVPPAPPPPTASGIKEVPDAVPRVEPRSRYGNPPFYEVMGKRYYVLSSGSDYVERGVASWYGPGFHQIRTSTGDIYDMYGMSAAHKTLPLPAYVRVTNLQNGRTCVVRVNDRGPFVGNRIIDLSYSAAAKLDMLRNGTAMVEIRTLDPTTYGNPPLLAGGTVTPSGAAPSVQAAQGTVAATAANAGAPPSGSPPQTTAAPAAVTPAGSTPAPAVTPPAGAPTGTAPLVVAPTTNRVPVPATLYIQAGAFADPENAQRLAAKLRDGNYGKIFVRDDVIAGRKLYRVRIGPVPNVPEFDRIVAALDRAGVHDAHLAMD